MEATLVHLSSPRPTTPQAGKAPGAAGVETWSGKDRDAENFPVGSLLISKKLRPHIHAFYAFARNADDIADNPKLTEAEKISRLGTMEDVLLGRRQTGSPTAAALRASLAHTGVTSEHARDLLHAFRTDSTKNRTASWADLMDYCRYSAMPVGRYVLDLHGESRDTWPHSDALCAVLQVTNHLQDCAKDFLDLDRVYLPADLLSAAGILPPELLRPAQTPQLRQVLDALLDKCTELNRAAAPLPRVVRNRRLRLECGVITGLARRLEQRLRRQDPLAMRVKLTKGDAARSVVSALRYLP
jgi:farnesyl-diphosphate farnesyltransferase